MTGILKTSRPHNELDITASSPQKVTSKLSHFCNAEYFIIIKQRLMLAELFTQLETINIFILPCMRKGKRKMFFTEVATSSIAWRPATKATRAMRLTKPLPDRWVHGVSCWMSLPTQLSRDTRRGQARFFYRLGRRLGENLLTNMFFCCLAKFLLFRSECCARIFVLVFCCY